MFVQKLRLSEQIQGRLTSAAALNLSSLKVRYSTPKLISVPGVQLAPCDACKKRCFHSFEFV